MDNKQPLIVGIDPGTTLGYALIDLKGKVVELSSSKNFDLNSLISLVVEKGKVILVGTDKGNVPNFVERFAAKTGAKLIHPYEDLLVKWKKEAIKKYKIKDEHQADALASALFTYKKIRSLIKKIDVFARHSKKEHLKNKLKELVIAKGISIVDALKILEPEKEEEKIIKKVVEERKLKEEDFLKLYNGLKKAEREIKLLRQYNTNLKDEMNNIKEKEKYMFNKIDRFKSDEKLQQLVEFKERRIHSFDRKIQIKNGEIGLLQEELTKLNQFLSRINKNLLLKKLDNLGQKEFDRKNKLINIQEKDILLIDDPNIVSDEVINILKNKVDIIIYKKEISKKIEKELPFIFINAKKLKIDKTKYFALVNKKEFEKEKSNIKILNKIIEDYKREKFNLV